MKLEEFQVLNKIGEGSSSQVFRVVSLQSKKEFAMKKIKKNKNPLVQEQIQRETETLQKLEHVNIVKFFDSFETDTHFYLILELCDGGTLAQLLEK